MRRFKRIALAAVGLCIAAVGFSQSKEIPYMSGLYQDSDWTIINVNGDEKTWASESSSYDFSATGFDSGVKYSYNSNQPADDWIVSPAITLEAGKEYKVKFWHKTKNYDECYALYAATANTPEALTAGTVISQHDNYKNESWQHDVEIFTPEVSSDYYFGFHAYSAKDKYFIFLTGFAIGENVFTPAAPGNLTVTAGENKAVTATLTWELPTTDDDGVPFGEGIVIEKVEIFRDGVSVATPGADAVTWTDTEELGLTPGFHTYEVQITAGGRTSAKANVKSPYIGPLQPQAIPWNANIDTMTIDDFNLFFTVFNTGISESSECYNPYWFMSISSWGDNYIGKYPYTGKKNDWVVSPPLKFEQAGKYRVAVNMASSTSSQDSNTSFYFGSGYNLESFGESTKIGTINAPDERADYSIYFDVETPGEYNLAIQELDPVGDQYAGTYIYSLRIEEAVEFPTNITGLSTDVEGENVKLTWTNPAKTVFGNDIAKLSKIEIFRNDEETPIVLTDDIYLTGGAEVSYTDTPGMTGVVSYKVIPYLGEYTPEGEVAHIYSGWVGDDTQELPYSCGFDDPLYYGLWKSHDLDNDQDTWSLTDGFAKLSLSKGADTQIKDELTSASFDLTPGYYEIGIYASSSYLTGKSLTVGLFKADAEDPTAFAASKLVALESYYYSTYTAILKIEEAGKYRIGFLYDGTGSADAEKYISMSDITLKAYPVLPGVATDLTATAAEGGALEVTLSWTNPSGTNVEGLDLDEITKAVVSRRYVTGNGPSEIIAEVTEGLVPGQPATYTDNTITESGAYEYSVEIYTGDNKSEEPTPAATTGWVGNGLSVPYTPTDFNAWYIYNVNEDSNVWGEELTWTLDFQGGAAITSSSSAADDWLISPPLNIEVGNKYVISVTHLQYYGSAIDFDIHAGLSTKHEDMTTFITTLTTAEETWTDKEDIVHVIGVDPQSLAQPASLRGATDSEYIQIPAGATSLGIHANNKCDMKIKSFKVDIMSGIEGITDSETLVAVEGIGFIPADATDIRVYDLAGNLIVKADSVAELDTVSLGQGVYLLTATANGKLLNIKFVK